MQFRDVPGVSQRSKSVPEDLIELKKSRARSRGFQAHSEKFQEHFRNLKQTSQDKDRKDKTSKSETIGAQG